MSSEKLMLHPNSPVTPEYLIDQLNEREGRIHSIAIAYDYLDDDGVVRTAAGLVDRGSPSQATYLARTLTVLADQRLVEILNGQE